MGGEQRRVRAHADDVLVVLVIGDAVHIVGHGQRLTFRRRRGGSKLVGLQGVVEPRRSHAEERRQDAIQAVVQQVVELAFGRHGHAGHGHLDLVLLHGDIVAVEVSAVIDVGAVHVDDGVVVRRLQFLLNDAPRVLQRLGHGTVDLGYAAQGVVGLHLAFEGGRLAMCRVVEFVLALRQAPAALGHLAQAACHVHLPVVAACGIEGFGHEVVIRPRHLVHP